MIPVNSIATKFHAKRVHHEAFFSSPLRFQNSYEPRPHFLKRQKLFNTRTFPPATHQASGKASLKTQLWDFWEQTLQKKTFDENINLFNRRLKNRGYPDNLTEKTLSEVKLSERMSALLNKQKTRKEIMPFVTEFRPSVPNLKNILMNKWHIMENQPVLKEKYKDPPLISYRRGRSLKDNTRES